LSAAALLFDENHSRGFKKRELGSPVQRPSTSGVGRSKSQENFMATTQGQRRRQ
jgi:hypothetical protein